MPYTTEQKVAAHEAAGFKLQDEARNDWPRLQVWLAANPGYRFTKGESMPDGRVFYQYFPKTRSKIVLIEQETLDRYRSRDRESRKIVKKLDKYDAKLRSEYRKIRRKAIGRGHVFGLSISEFDEILSHPCFYCGVGALEGKWLGIDRMNSHLSYSYDNCVACCWPCNTAKGARSPDEFVSHVRRIAARFA